MKRVNIQQVEDAIGYMTIESKEEKQALARASRDSSIVTFHMPH